MEVKDYKKFYGFTENYLNGIADKHKVSNLKKYFSPDVPQKKNMSTLFKRLCFHTQNSSRMRNSIKWDDNYNVIEKFTENFDVVKFLNNYNKCKNEEDIYKIIIKKFENLMNSSGKNIETYSKTIYTSAKFLSNFKTYDGFIKKMQDCGIFAPEYLKKNIIGLGSALACDFLKELDPSFDICKPDVHVSACIKKFSEIPDYVEGDLCDFLVRMKVTEIAKQIDISAYKLDKMLYLICSENFYLDNNKRNNTSKFRDDFIGKIMDKEQGIF